MTTTAAWGWLVLAGLVEIAWAAGIKYTQGWTRPGPSVAVVALYLLDLFLLSIPMSRLPIGTAYSVWVGHRQPGRDHRGHHAVRGGGDTRASVVHRPHPGGRDGPEAAGTLTAGRSPSAR